MFRKKHGTALNDAAPAKSSDGSRLAKVATGRQAAAKLAAAKVAGATAIPATATRARSTPATATTLSKGQQAYEARRAEKAGMGLEKWMAEKDKRVQAEREAVQRAHKKAAPAKPGLLRRLLDKAHRPI